MVNIYKTQVAYTVKSKPILWPISSLPPKEAIKLENLNLQPTFTNHISHKNQESQLLFKGRTGRLGDTGPTIHTAMGVEM